jgi:hypothetical protein
MASKKDGLFYRDLSPRDSIPGPTAQQVFGHLFLLRCFNGIPGCGMPDINFPHLMIKEVIVVFEDASR